MEEKTITPRQLINQLQMGLLNISSLIEEYEKKLKEQAEEIKRLSSETNP